MIFKKTKVLLLSVAVAVTIAIIGVGVGCYYVGSSTGTAKEEPRNIVSYVSVDSQIYGSTAQVVSAVADSVVEIQTESTVTQWGKQYIVSGAGSGVIVSQSQSLYYVVTNNHVIDGTSEIIVTTRSGNEYKAELVATDDSADIAVLTINSERELSVAIWGDSDKLCIGDDLVAIGNPLGNLGGTVTKGILSASSRKISVGNYAMTLLQTDTAINPGNSGGGLFNMRGELIGIVNAKTTDEEIEGICFAIPGNTARSVYEELVKYGYLLGRSTFNLTLAEGSLSSGMNMQAQPIVYVTATHDAAADTFKQYDRIYKINGSQISSILDYNVALSQIKPGDTVTVEVYRGTIVQGYFGGNSISFALGITSFSVVAAQYGVKS